MRKFNPGLAAAAGVWSLFALIVLAEFSSPFKGLLASAFGHHWIGKGVVSAAIFVIGGFAVRKKAEKAERAGWYSTIAVFVLIFAFYLLEWFA